ncbi:branched-chain amino acid ABC transporter permease [Mesorhizobium sp. WSM4976]|uniref:branched-chain amino acid ABC transporter permease n=1 Tax=Mesorhizobium sp. WSM4976 TaxID=3038549 RepID=UPI0024175B74|nr:branched-chain amino acid ABC transporter permease [Mesorhizobium sp. WSM4976]MDG4892148.1 branched-chain amino acid ABC transporter permease [Mesorhizobium sp. WSM4976]
MDVLIQIVASGLTLGAMYAVATIGLSLVYGSLNMLNMAHGAILTLGGYICYAAIVHAGLHPTLALLAAAFVCALVGLMIYFSAALPLLRAENFETNIFIATIGIGSVIENLMLKGFGPYPIPQPLAVDGQVVIGNVHIPLQNVFILGVAIVLMVGVAILLQRTSAGRAIRATSMNREAAQLMGVRVGRIYAQVLALSGALAAVSGIMISSIATLTPVMGGDPMLKAFIVCVVAGLGNVYGAVVAAIALGLLEAATQYVLGVRWSFATLLLLVILVLIWRPYGLFGKQQVVRL